MPGQAAEGAEGEAGTLETPLALLLMSKSAALAGSWSVDVSRARSFFPHAHLHVHRGCSLLAATTRVVAVITLSARCGLLCGYLAGRFG
jgi:hypothetical protein